MTRVPSPRAAGAAVVSLPPAVVLPPLRGNNVALARFSAELLAPGAAAAFAARRRRVPIAVALAQARRERDAAQATYARLGEALGQVAEAAREVSRKAS
jgi:hypothetical protein